MSGPYGTTSDYPPLLLQHAGIWEGNLRKLTNQGKQIYAHRTKIEIGMKGSRWLQRNTYRWDDGRTQTSIFEAKMENGHHTFDGAALKGYTKPLDEATVSFYCERKGKNESFWEVIRLLGDGRRIRTWQIWTDDRVEIVQVEEEKISDEDVYSNIEGAL